MPFLERLIRCLASVALICAAPTVLAGPSKMELYKSWHDVCLKGDTGQIDAQIAKFEARIAADPADHLAEAFLGSACALRAKASFWGPTKLSYLKRGQRLLEAAVAAAPKNPRVRAIRAIGYYRVPERFKLRPTSLQDFQFLVPIARDGKGGLTVGERQAILYYASRIYAEEGRGGSQELKALCHRLDPDSEFGKLTK